VRTGRRALGTLPKLHADVVSGDPDHRSVVLWTRLAPEPLDPAALGDRTVPVQWEVYADERLRRPVARGLVHARPDDAHAVHVEVGALRPDRWYWYRFRTGPHLSPVGRTRTFPAPGQATERLRFALASCQMCSRPDRGRRGAGGAPGSEATLPSGAGDD
jgi:alkaline phosphatase D